MTLSSQWVRQQSTAEDKSVVLWSHIEYLSDKRETHTHKRNNNDTLPIQSSASGSRRTRSFCLSANTHNSVIQHNHWSFVYIRESGKKSNDSIHFRQHNILIQDSINKVLIIYSFCIGINLLSSVFFLKSYQMLSWKQCKKKKTKTMNKLITITL